jgi:hypothetical protein
MATNIKKSLKEIHFEKDNTAKESLNKHFSQVISLIKKENSKHVKAEEVEKILSKHKNFASDVKFDASHEHVFFSFTRVAYGQSRILNIKKGLINTTGTNQRANTGVDPWNYNVENKYSHKLDEILTLDDTFNSYSCSSCKGSGNETCITCDGSGKLWVESIKGYEACTTCGGARVVNCKPCKGYGSLYDIAELKVRHHLVEYCKLLLNSDKEKDWVKYTAKIQKGYHTVYDLHPNKSEDWVTEGQISELEEPELLQFNNESIESLQESRGRAELICDNAYFVNKYNMMSIDMTYNGKTKTIGVINNPQFLEFSLIDLQGFFDTERNELTTLSNKRSFKKKVFVLALLVILALAYFSYGKYNDQKYLKLRSEIEAPYKELVIKNITDRNYEVAHDELKLILGKLRSNKLYRSYNLKSLNAILTHLKKDIQIQEIQKSAKKDSVYEAEKKLFNELKQNKISFESICALFIYTCDSSKKMNHIPKELQTDLVLKYKKVLNLHSNDS